MTIRSDVDLDFAPSPRIAVVQTPSVEFVAQDIVDTLRTKEETFRGLSEFKLLDAAGKEELGGGVRVGITVALQNTQIAFEGRTTPAQIGSVTTDSTTPIAGRIQLIDTSATFLTNNIVRGSLIINFNDQSVAEVYSVESETQLTTKLPVNGIDNSFDIGDTYHIFNIQQCDISGGNVVALDNNNQQIPPVLPTAFTQVVRTASSSATLQEQEILQYSSFGGGITFDEDSPYAGTKFPIGTPQEPVNNVQDAYTIAIDKGFRVGYILSNMTLPTNIPLTYFTFIGSGKDRTIITIPDIANVSDCTYIDAEVTGYLDGNNTLQDCLITNLNYIKGYIEGCVLAAGTITLAGTEAAHFLDCYSGKPGAGIPVIDCGGSGQDLAIRNYNGGIKLTNKTGLENISIDLNSGQVILDPTVTAGTIVVRGVGKLVDENNIDIMSGTWNGATVINETVNPENTANIIWNSQLSKYNNSGTFGGHIGKKLLTLAKYLGLK